MKKVAVILILSMILSMLVSCDIIFGGQNVTPGEGGNNNVVDGNQPDDTNKEENDDSNNQEENKPQDDVNSHLITVNEIKGLNEQIVVKIQKNDGFKYRVLYKNVLDDDFIELDNNLMIEDDTTISSYVLGLKSGKYDVKIEAESENDCASKLFGNVDVESQDRSGYAHFGYTDGIGAYNDDGTVKSNAKILYVTNENKNTVTMTIDGVEYVGLVNILQAQYRSDTPMLVRVIGKITTNQWNYKNVAPRLSDGSNATSDFFENTFSNEYGENLANLIVKMKGNGLDAKTYNYRTTSDGLTEVRLTNGGTKYANYKGSDFPSLVGKQVFDDDSYYNMLEVKGSKNITIEGIGSDAEIFQFGISFEECSSIEIKNLTFTDYPEDALNFLGGNRSDLSEYGRYWIHSCTFNRGYNAWDISGERDKYAGDGSVDFNNVSNTTLSYNKFDNSKKSMLFGSGDSEACMNFTMHHNYFYKVESRLPLGRNVNIHSYNNYFDQCKNCSDVRKNSYIFSENNYFNSTLKPFILSSSMVKSFGDAFVGSSASGVTVVTDRAQVVSISCKPDNKTNCSSFDTNSELFYYDSVNRKTDVAIMHDALDLPVYIVETAGAGHFELIEIDG